MSKLKDLFTQDVIDYYKNNQNEITEELLSKIRSYGNEGKELALEILDTKKSDDNYYLDAFGNKLSYNGDRNLKGAYSQMNLAPIHVKEIEKCLKDLMYFKDNYIKIRTKDGISFPELRTYQVEFLNQCLDDNSEGIVQLAGRQCGKSITTAIYLTWQFNFNKDANIGICANKGSLAREFLNNVKMIFQFLPMWMRVGITVWNKSSIESENKMRVLTDVPSENAFRGFSCKILVVDECAWIASTKYQLFKDSVFPSQSSFAWKKNIILSTPNGINHFKQIVDDAKSGKSGYKYVYVDWRTVPRYDSKGNLLTPEQFKESIVNKYGETFFSQNYACVDGSTIVNIYDNLNMEYKQITIRELYDVLTIWEDEDWNTAIDRAKQFINSNRFTIETIDGYSSFDGIAKHLVNSTLKIYFGTQFIEVSKNHKFIVFGDTVQADTLKIGDRLQVKNSDVRITNIVDCNESKYVYDILETSNHSYIANDVVNHNCDFIGSSYTLIDSKILSDIKSVEPEFKYDNLLDVYEEPAQHHKYILSADPAKGGLDAFAVQIIDISSKPFKQVASAQIFKCNYQKMPMFLDEWGKRYNNAFMIVENNEGAGTYCATALQSEYEYPNLYFDKTSTGKKKQYAGFRTTPKSRNLILDTLKLFVNEKLLIVNDKNTINEFFTFIIKDGKYQADDGCHDDMIMSLALAFAPFSDTKNFEDLPKLINSLYDKNVKEVDFSDYLAIGNFDTIDDDNYQNIDNGNDFVGFF